MLSHARRKEIYPPWTDSNGEGVRGSSFGLSCRSISVLRSSGTLIDSRKSLCALSGICRMMPRRKSAPYAGPFCCVVFRVASNSSQVMTFLSKRTFDSVTGSMFFRSWWMNRVGRMKLVLLKISAFAWSAAGGPEVKQRENGEFC